MVQGHLRTTGYEDKNHSGGSSDMMVVMIMLIHSINDDERSPGLLPESSLRAGLRCSAHYCLAQPQLPSLLHLLPGISDRSGPSALGSRKTPGRLLELGLWFWLNYRAGREQMRG